MQYIEMLKKAIDNYNWVKKNLKKNDNNFEKNNKIGETYFGIEKTYITDENKIYYFNKYIIIKAYKLIFEDNNHCTNYHIIIINNKGYYQILFVKGICYLYKPQYDNNKITNYKPFPVNIENTFFAFFFDINHIKPHLGFIYMPALETEIIKACIDDKEEMVLKIEEERGYDIHLIEMNHDEYKNYMNKPYIFQSYLFYEQYIFLKDYNILDFFNNTYTEEN